VPNGVYESVYLLNRNLGDAHSLLRHLERQIGTGGELIRLLRAQIQEVRALRPVAA
jgi:hypothetical protein